jgi:hypothetical protein
MDFRLLLASSLGLAVGTAAVVACTTPAPAQNNITTRPDSKHKGDDDDTTTGDDDDVVVDRDASSDKPLPDGGKPPGRIYAHTASALYLFDPLVQTLKKVGDFDGFDNDLGDSEVLDIALDSDSAMYGTTDFGFVRIDPTTAKITYIKKGSYFSFPNALSFVPVGTVDPTKEALVGYIQKDDAFGATTYVRVDLTTGQLSELGELNASGAALNWRSSGDIIATFRGGNKAYLTVKLFNPDGGTVEADPGTDSLAQVDPKTGKLIKIVGDIGQPNFYGLGAWAGTSYGFNAGGNIVQINMDTGAGKTILTLKEDGGATGSWYGAGMTTAAPTAP